MKKMKEFDDEADDEGVSEVPESTFVPSSAPPLSKEAQAIFKEFTTGKRIGPLQKEQLRACAQQYLFDTSRERNAEYALQNLPQYLRVEYVRITNPASMGDDRRSAESQKIIYALRYKSTDQTHQIIRKKHGEGL